MGSRRGAGAAHCLRDPEVKKAEESVLFRPVASCFAPSGGVRGAGRARSKTPPREQVRDSAPGCGGALVTQAGALCPAHSTVPTPRRKAPAQHHKHGGP